MNNLTIDCILGLVIIISGLSAPFVILANIQASNSFVPVEFARSWHN